MMAQFLKTGHNRIIPQPFKFVIRNHPSARRLHDKKLE
jgi:hypothetical protein